MNIKSQGKWYKKWKWKLQFGQASPFPRQVSIWSLKPVFSPQLSLITMARLWRHRGHRKGKHKTWGDENKECFIRKVNVQIKGSNCNLVSSKCPCKVLMIKRSQWTGSDPGFSNREVPYGRALGTIFWPGVMRSKKKKKRGGAPRVPFGTSFKNY